MRDLPGSFENAVGRRIVAPIYLVELTLLEPLFASTRQSVSFDGSFYESGNIKEIFIGQNEASFSIYNEEYQFTKGALTGDFLRKEVKIYSTYALGENFFPPYVTPGYWPDFYVKTPANADPVLLFVGRISSADISGEWLMVECERDLPRKYPRGKIRAPFANHLPATGQVVEWNGQSYRIES